MSESKIAVEPYKSGLVYYTVIHDGTMVHLNSDHVLVVDLGNGDVMHLTWEEVKRGLAHVIAESKKEQEIAARVLAKQQEQERREAPKQDPAKPEGYKKQEPTKVEKPKLSKKAQASLQKELPDGKR